MGDDAWVLSTRLRLIEVLQADLTYSMFAWERVFGVAQETAVADTGMVQVSAVIMRRIPLETP